MTGIFMRVKRNDVMVNLELEHLTDKEREHLFKDRPKMEIIKFMNGLCNSIQEKEDADYNEHFLDSMHQD